MRGIRDMMRMMRMIVAIRLIYSWRGIVETHAGGNLTEKDDDFAYLNYIQDGVHKFKGDGMTNT